MVNIIWSLTNGGAALTSAVNHGSVGNGNTATAQELFLRHDGANEITDVGLYVRAFTGTYAGTFNAASDLAEFLAWGDGTTANAFGGLQCNLLATTAYPASAWPTYLDKSPTGGFVHRTGVGDSEGNAVTLPITTGTSASGTIQTGSSPNVRFKMRIAIPADEDTVGYRQIDQLVTYNYTS